MAQLPSHLELIPLERRFAALSDSAEVSVEFLRWAGKTLTWEDVLAKRCSVVFGEAGTGKSAEFRATASAVIAAGKLAFLLPIEAVAQRGVVRSLDLKSGDRFGRWQQQPTTDAWLFLDAVDEAKLKGQVLSDVLRVLAREVDDNRGPLLGRV